MEGLRLEYWVGKHGMGLMIDVGMLVWPWWYIRAVELVDSE